MIINFDSINEVKLDNFKGGQGYVLAHMYDDENGKIMYATLKKGCSIGYHKHETNSEICYVLSGKATFNYNGNEEVVSKGQVHYCPKGESHSCINNEDEDLIMYCVIPNR